MKTFLILLAPLLSVTSTLAAELPMCFANNSKNTRVENICVEKNRIKGSNYLWIQDDKGSDRRYFRVEAADYTSCGPSYESVHCYEYTLTLQEVDKDMKSDGSESVILTGKDEADYSDSMLSMKSESIGGVAFSSSIATNEQDLMNIVFENLAHK